MSAADLFVITMNLIVAGAVTAFCVHRDRGLLSAMRLGDLVAEPQPARG